MGWKMTGAWSQRPFSEGELADCAYSRAKSGRVPRLPVGTVWIPGREARVPAPGGARVPSGPAIDQGASSLADDREVAAFRGWLARPSFGYGFPNR